MHYLRSIAETKPSEAAPLPHLERHQAWLLLRGIKYYKDYETYGLAASGTFNYYIYPDFLREVNDLFQKKLEPPKGLFPYSHT